MKALLDTKLWITHNHIAGVDEAGRGPLAGPVVASAVILPRHFHHPEIDDSKKLSPSKRAELAKLIIEQAICYGYGIVEPETIDRINILNATKLAMTQAIENLDSTPEIVLIDALHLDTIAYSQIPLIRGDTLSISIAAASILAKVKRDSIMEAYHERYPHYFFNRHKGYPTKLHRECIRKHGPCAIHRKTFRLLAQTEEKN